MTYAKSSLGIGAATCLSLAWLLVICGQAAGFNPQPEPPGAPGRKEEIEYRCPSVFITVILKIIKERPEVFLEARFFYIFL